MCGIAGLAGGGDRGAIERMTLALRHRGPDGQGFHLDEKAGVFLGHRRLSIIDLGGGAQPMYNEDRSLVVVFNGEIYNYQELRAELQARGHTFRSNCDTEVLLHGYEEHGADLPRRLLGMFAFALWDGRSHELFLARDRLGKKPLYYRARGGRISFASELGALMLAGHSERKISAQALSDYLTFKYVPEPATIYEDVLALPAGHVLRWKDGESHLSQYWELTYGEPLRVTEEEAAEELGRLLTEAVRCRLMSDVPLGALLSGGMDSSTVVALMCRVCNTRVKTFSVGFEERTFSELPHAKLVADHLGTDHHEAVVRPDAATLVDRLTEHFGQPFADSSAIPTYLLSEFTRGGVTVALSGDAGDEVFAGYETYRAWRAMARYQRIPRCIRGNIIAPVVRRLPVSDSDVSFDFRAKRFVQGDGLPLIRRHLFWMTQIDDDRKAELLGPRGADLLPAARILEELPGLPADELARLQFLDTKVYLPGDILVKVDRMSMAHSLEVRVPLLDHRVVEFAARLPGAYRLRGMTTKHVLRRLAASLLPPSILRRPKKGFTVPLARWLRRDLREMLLDTLSERQVREQGFFNPAAVSTLIQEHMDRKADRSRDLWTLMVFTRWLGCTPRPT